MVGLVAAAALLGAVGVTAAPASAQTFAASPTAVQSPGSPTRIPVDLNLNVDTGTYLPLVQVSINGSAPITMMLDAGTNMMVTFPGVLDSVSPPPTNTGIPMGIDYNGTSTSGTLATATVSIGGVSTPQPIAFLDGSSCTPACLGASHGAQGVLGIGQRVSTGHPASGYELYSALAQLGGDYAKGYSIDFTGSSPYLQLGAPTVVGGSDVVLQRETQGDNEHYSNGQTIYLPTSPMCWTIGSGPYIYTTCAETVIDTGEGAGIIRGEEYLPLVNPVNAPPLPGSGIQLQGWLKQGTVVAISSSLGATPFTAYVAPDAAPYKMGLYTGGAHGGSQFNTGNGFYLQHRVGFDNVTGSVVIGSADGTPSGPRDANATAGDSSVDVSWRAPQSPGSAPISDYVVTVSSPDGTAVSNTTVPGSTTDARINGLTNGEHYVVDVAAANASGIGKSARVPGEVMPAADVSAPTPTPTSTSTSMPLPALADTGGDASHLEWVAVGGLAVVSIGAVLVLLARRWRGASRPLHKSRL